MGFFPGNPFFQMILDAVVVAYAYWMITGPVLLLLFLILHSLGVV